MSPPRRSADRDSPGPHASRSGSPLTFILLVFLLSAPFWLIGAVIERPFLEGLPVSALATFCPMIAALILTRGANRAERRTSLLKRSFDLGRIANKAWYVPILFLNPAMAFLSYELMRSWGMPLPPPHVSIPAALALFVAFFIGAVGEEVGWSGYLLDRMQERWGVLGAGILLGSVWAVWHLVPYVQAHRSPTWIAWQCLNTVATRVLLVWLFNNTGKSVFAAILYHAIGNVCVFLFPNFGSHFDPRVAGLVHSFAAVIVTVAWGPRTLARDGAP